MTELPRETVTPMQRYGPLRFLPAAPTDAQREAVQASKLVRHGDAVLVWVNEGDLCNLSLEAARIPAEPSEEASLLKLRAVIEGSSLSDSAKLGLCYRIVCQELAAMRPKRGVTSAPSP